MAMSHATYGLFSMILLMGSIVMLFFVILAGVTRSTPLDQTFFLRADTKGISGARDISQWTFFYICGDGNNDCGRAIAGLPFGAAWDANKAGVPEELGGEQGDGTTSFAYFYMWRFAWVLYLITLAFEVAAFIFGFLAKARLGAVVSGMLSLVALVFYTVAVSLMTATFVKARDAFRAVGRDANIGTYGFAFSWGAWGALFVATMLLVFGYIANRRQERAYANKRTSRRKSTRSSRSYDMTGRRVKEEYV